MRRGVGRVRGGLFAAVGAGVLALVGPAVAQPVAWTQLNPVVRPFGNFASSMTYDSIRGVAVLIQQGAEGSTETWEWDGAAWTLRATSGPAGNTGGDMAFDSSRGLTVYSGRNSGGTEMQTWEWNGTAWTQLPVTGPSMRVGHAVEYDPVRGVTVLFGGRTAPAQVYLDDTWDWNGTAWTNRLVSGPSPRFAHGMVFDSARQVMVLFGGYANGQSLGTTWEWNGTAWTFRSNSGPFPRNGVGMAFDQRRGLTVLFGGYNSGANTVNAETWEWNGMTWSQAMLSGPPARQLCGMVYHAATEGVFMFGGLGVGSSINDSWRLRCTSTTITSHPRPAAVCSVSNAAFSVVASAPDPITYTWQIKVGPDLWQPLTDTPAALPCGGTAWASPANTASTDIAVVPCAGVSVYEVRVIASTARCTATSNPATLSFVSFPSADINADGVRDSQDYFQFVCEFLGGCPHSPHTDFNDDGEVNSGDFFAFLGAFFAGC